MTHALPLLVWLVACSGSDGTTSDTTPPTETASDTGSPPTGETGVPVPTVLATLGPPVTLTFPGVGVMHHHATVAWGADDFLLAFVSGSEPDTRALARRFGADGAPLADPVALNDLTPVGDKPDVEWDGARWVVGYDDSRGGVHLRAITPAGAPLGPSRLLLQSDLDVDAVDLAVQPDGSGVAIWTESGAPYMAPDDGRIAWRAFDAALAPVGAPRLAVESSFKATDASPLPDGGWVGVWAIDYDHPTDPDEVLYEVWGRLYRGDGTSSTFRADDLDAAWPSRPAVAVADDGALAVSWRDKTASRGEPAGAFGRLFDADAAPRGPSVSLHPGGDGDRVVSAWAGELALFVWQETDTDGRPGVWLTALHGPTGGVVVDRLAVHPAGGDRDERPSVSVRAVGAGYEVLLVWETFTPEGVPRGIVGRTVTLSIE